MVCTHDSRLFSSVEHCSAELSGAMRYLMLTFLLMVVMKATRAGDL